MSREFTFRYTGQVGVWRVALVAPKKEASVIAQLKPSLFEVYSPTVTGTRKVNGFGRTEKVERPVLPGYLFIRNLCPNSPPLMTIRGINFVMPNACSQAVIDRARIIGEKVAAEMTQAQVPQLFSPVADAVIPPTIPYAPGDPIETLDGTLRGIFMGVTLQNRVSALCLMFGAERMIELSPEKVRPSLS